MLWLQLVMLALLCVIAWRVRCLEQWARTQAEAATAQVSAASELRNKIELVKAGRALLRDRLAQRQG